MDEPTSLRKPAQASRLRAIGLVVLALGTAWWGRSLVVRGAMTSASSWAERLGGLAVVPPHDAEDVQEADDFEDPRAEPESAEELAEPGAEGAPSSRQS